MSNTQYAWTHLEGDTPAERHLRDGDTVHDFRGEEWIFASVSRSAYGNSTGRVTVRRECPDAYNTSHGGRECVHIWHRDGVEVQEYFPSVFGLYLGDAEGNEA